MSLYPNLLNNPEFAGMSIVDFVSKFDKAALPANSKTESTVKYQKIYNIDTGKFIRTLQRRSKEPVLYFNLHSQSEQFYYSMLFLYKP